VDGQDDTPKRLDDDDYYYYYYYYFYYYYYYYLPHIDQWLCPDNHPLGVHLQDITEEALNLVTIILEGGSPGTHGKPGGACCAHRLLSP